MSGRCTPASAEFTATEKLTQTAVIPVELTSLIALLIQKWRLGNAFCGCERHGQAERCSTVVLATSHINISVTSICSRSNMYISRLAKFTWIASLLSSSAAQRSLSSTPSLSCPHVCSTIASDLKSSFSECNNLARSAIRFDFHDAGENIDSLSLSFFGTTTERTSVAGYSSKTVPYGPASGGPDSSLLLNSAELNRAEQEPLQLFGRFLQGKYRKYQTSRISAADFVQCAGSIGVRSCPGGPVYKTVCLASHGVL